MKKSSIGTMDGQQKSTLCASAEDSDYDQFALITNAVYPYIRLTKRRGNSHIPCGGAVSPATDGWFASKPGKERDKWCPKIAWGFAAVFLANLKYDYGQKDYVLLKDSGELIQGYCNKYLTMYLQSHNGLKYKSLSDEQKELNFIEEHKAFMKSLWEKSEPLKAYSVLYGYARDAEVDYEIFLQKREDTIIGKNEDKPEPPTAKELGEHRIINQNGRKSVYVENNTGTIIIGSDMPRNNQFNTEIRTPFPDKPCIKVFFFDDTVASQAKPIIEGLNSVRKVNISQSQSGDHPGDNLTVYPKSMITAKFCETEIIEALTLFFSSSSIQDALAKNKQTRIVAHFENIENQVLSVLDKARVSIHVAMAWFTNQKIADKLVEKYKEGLDVKVVSFVHPVNSRFGVNIDSITHKVIRGTKGGTMHDKFCVIDNQIVITGSYNWSVTAENKNDENSNVIYDNDNASNYSVEFRRLFNS